MAGSAAFDYLFAGGSAYSPSFEPMPNLASLFISQSYSLTLSLLDLNEDYAELALLPMQILIFREWNKRARDEAAEAAGEEIENAVSKAVEKARDILRERDKDFAGPEGRTMGRSGAVSGEFLRELAEERKKGALRAALQGYTMNKWGPLGAIAAGWAYDGQISAATIHDVVTASLKKEIVSLGVQTLSKALGITSAFGTLAIGLALDSLFTETFEVMSGLDNHFGFGGDLAGFTSKGEPMYEQKIDFLDGVKRSLGFDIGRIELENQYGQTVGYEWKGKKFEYARPIEKFSDYLNTPARNMGLTRANRFMDAGSIMSRMNQGYSRSQIERALEKSTFGSVAGFKPDGFSPFGRQLYSAAFDDIADAVAPAIAKTQQGGGMQRLGTNKNTFEGFAGSRFGQTAYNYHGYSRWGKTLGMQKFKEDYERGFFGNREVGSRGGINGTGAHSRGGVMAAEAADKAGKSGSVSGAMNSGRANSSGNRRGGNISGTTGNGKTSRGEKSRQRQAERNSGGNKSGKK
nr:hypothetical protein [uncultured Campylobacter sp.]